jgi:hypothetical protein
MLDTFDTVQDPEEKKIILERFLSRVRNNKDKLVNEIQKKMFFLQMRSSKGLKI